MHKTVVINAVGLTQSLIGEHTPRLGALQARGRCVAIEPALPAVTCSVQATYLTGKWPSEHGIVGNGWYFRDTCEVRFWHQSDALVEAPRIWDLARQIDPAFTCANINWWHAMYSSADITLTPRPMYPADGRKLPDIWTHPPELRDSLQRELGQFPLFKYWGPMTSIDASAWLTEAAVRVDQQYDPTLTLLYLPHLDYNFQRFGPPGSRRGVSPVPSPETDRHGRDAHATEVLEDLRALDQLIGRLVDHFAGERNARVIVLSEYGIAPVSRPVHLNRALREHGLLAVREEKGHELLDAGASAAFAVADHQVAHVYVNDPSRLSEVQSLVAGVPGVAEVLDEAGKRGAHLDHPRAGELVAVAEPDAWFTYYYWLDEARAPDFAPTVDIHRKPGYDPAELFLNPQLRSPKLRVLKQLIKRKLGLRALLDVIPTEASLVKGSHGRAPARPDKGAMLLTNWRNGVSNGETVAPTEVAAIILRHLQG